MGLQVSEFELVRRLLQQRAGIVLDRDKGYLVEVRLGALARREGYGTLEELLGALQKCPEGQLGRRVVEAMTTNETFFFRDSHPFESLRHTILPELMRKRSGERTLRIWCGACATGQEPYSVAMLLRDHFPTLMGWHLRILATDLSTEMVERARSGRFSTIEVGRGLTPALLARHFHRQGTDWVLAEEVRRMVEFRTLNLLDSWSSLGTQDLVLLRNVLIYLDSAIKKGILARVRQVLVPDGYLLLGAAETTLNVDEQFEVVQLERTTWYRPGRLG